MNRPDVILLDDCDATDEAKLRMEKIVGLDLATLEVAFAPMVVKAVKHHTYLSKQYLQNYSTKQATRFKMKGRK